jgi:hypothetical protein
MMRGIQTMARNQGRQRRALSPSLSLSENDDSHDPNHPRNSLAAEVVVNNGVQLARWTEERVFLLLETIESAPNRLYQESPNWGKAVPHSRRGTAPPKNCLANIEYGDIGNVLARAQSDLNSNLAYLALSLNVPISEAVLRTKYNEQLAIAKRLRNEAPDKLAFDLDESHSRTLMLALKINRQIQSGEARRSGVNFIAHTHRVSKHLQPLPSQKILLAMTKPWAAS